MQINDILREELALNKQKLGMASLHNISKNELLEELRSRLEQFRESAINNGDIKTLLTLIDKSLKVDEHLDSFKKHFEQVHSGFFTRLSSRYPDLTDRERKVCAYYRINLLNKEIAILFGIEPDSVIVRFPRSQRPLCRTSGNKYAFAKTVSDEQRFHHGTR